MSWARFDDRFYTHPKVRQAWRSDPRAVGLHVLAIAYCAMHETDGHIDPLFVDDMVPAKHDREAAVQALVESGLWDRNGSGYVVHDYLDYQPSRAQLVDRRRKDSERKRATGAS